ncbi:MAG: hypothetical protein AAFY73_05185 [Pseudomonadota bacterium]
MHDWLRRELEPGDYANHGAGYRQFHETAYYFRDIEIAQRFVARFPELELADRTANALRAVTMAATKEGK